MALVVESPAFVAQPFVESPASAEAAQVFVELLVFVGEPVFVSEALVLIVALSVLVEMPLELLRLWAFFLLLPGAEQAQAFLLPSMELEPSLILV